MDQETYEALAACLDLPVGACPNTRLLLKRFPGLRPCTVASIFSQGRQYKVIKTNHLHKQRAQLYLRRYAGGESLLALAADVDFPPCMLLRHMLEQLLPRGHRQAVSDILRNPRMLLTLAESMQASSPQPPAASSCAAAMQAPAGSAANNLAAQHAALAPAGVAPAGLASAGTSSSSMGGGLPAAAATGSANNGDAGVIHDPINDVVSSSKSGSGSHSGSTYTSSCPALSLTPALAARLADDAVRAVYADCAYSSYSDVAKQVVGLEFESRLQLELSLLRVPCWTEAQLRAQGYHKTPDVKLKVPIAVRDPLTGQQRVVTWIDSKAAFGDARMHARQQEEQYATYVNRYGPGAVIYWFGYVRQLASADSAVLLLDAFPHAADVTLLPGTMLPGTALS